MSTSVQKIPEKLIYERIDGKPIYYQGYRDYLDGKVPIEALMGSSLLQSALVTHLLIILYQKFGNKYHLLSNEIGIQLGNNSWRAADLAVVEKEKLGTHIAENKYLSIPPKIVIEIDTKAALDEVNNTFGYYHHKTKQLLNFGVEKVIWIFTDVQSVLVADNKEWKIIDWQEGFEILDGLFLNIAQITEELI